jgi:predicted nuclease of predicted toxin-antitoxin system
VKIKVDENLPTEVADDLRAMGHDAETVFSESLSGAADPHVIDVAAREGRALITLDKGIADVRRYPPSKYYGIILLRPRTTGRLQVMAFVRTHIPLIPMNDPRGHLIVISEVSIRVRRA